MVALKTVAVLVVFFGFALAATTHYLAYRVGQRFPPIGNFATIDDLNIHFIEEQAGDSADLPALVFIHGAGGNARDLHAPLADRLRGRARMIFVDRPGAGYSQRGEGPELDHQAFIISGLLNDLNIEDAIIVGHSFGSAVSLAMALEYPDRVGGMMLVAPASHQWPGGAVTWYYRLASLPLIGRLFTETLAVPFGNLLYSRAVGRIFDPDNTPVDYEKRSGTRLLLRPRNFRSNAADVAGLYDQLGPLSQRYGEITVPTIIITGDSDKVVSPVYHAQQLAEVIKRSDYIELPNAGHMPAHTRPELLVSEIERLAQKMQRRTDLAAE